MRFIRTLAVTALVTLAGAACADLEVTNLNAPDRERALATPNDVENLIAGSFQTYYGAWYFGYPSLAMSVAADRHSASWGNWGMRNISEEPRIPLDNNPAYAYSGLMETPWGNSYAAISSASAGIAAINDGIQIGTDGGDNPRALFLAKLVQGLAHGHVAAMYDKGFVVDETTDLESIDASAFVEPSAIYQAAMIKLDEALAIATANDFTIPSEWVGYGGSWDQDFQIKYVNGMKARLTLAQPRTASEAAALPWGQIRTWAEASFDETDDGYVPYAADSGDWSWTNNKTYAGAFSGYYGWGRVDVRHIGPADASGNYAGWLATPVAERNGINIDTDDSRVTGQVDNDGDGVVYDEDGSLYTFWGSSPFRASRGTYHFSHYAAGEWDYLVLEGGNWEGDYPDLVPYEIQMILAEALYRTGDEAGAMAIVNTSRENGDLPPFADPASLAPGGDRCVPKPVGTACGTLWDALQYDKRIDLHHYGPGTEYFDDRRWGNLVAGTPLEFPVPGAELQILLEEIYTFGGVGGNSSAPNIVTDFSPEAIKLKVEGLNRYNRHLVSERAGLVPIH